MQEDKTKDDLIYSRAGDAQSDMEKTHRLPSAHEHGYRHSDQECCRDALDHDEPGGAHAVIITDETEPEAGKQAVDAVGFKIIRSQHDYSGVFREDPCQKVSVEKGEKEHDHADERRRNNGISQSREGPVVFACAFVLGDKSRHGVHECGWYQHDERAHFFSYTYAGRIFQPEAVDHGHNDQKRDAHHKVLKCDRRSQGKHVPDDFSVFPYIFSSEGEGKPLLFYDDQ